MSQTPNGPTAVSNAESADQATDGDASAATDKAANAGKKSKTAPEDSWELKYAELQDQYLRLQADFQNFRKRVEGERESLLKYGAERTLNDLLPVLDNLERGIGSLSESSDPKLLYQSFRLVLNQLLEGLGNQGLKKMETVGQPFDPFYHEAIQQQPNAEHPENTVIAEAQQGYLLYDRVLRPAMVIVSAGGDASPATDDNPFTPPNG